MIEFRVFQLEQNMGHGVARRKGLEECKNSLVALMDSDDISLPNRFECQLEAFYKHPELSIVGGQISEFIGSQDNITGIRIVPETDHDIKQYMKKRCPMNQVSVMFKKEEVQKVGGYIDWYCEEDYYLWTRMALGGCTFFNVPEVLVNVRVGDEMSARRGGVKYFLSEAKMQKYLYKNNIVGPFTYLYNLAIRFLGEVVVPSKLRVKLFRLFRKKADSIDQSHHIRERKTIIKRKDYPPFSVSICVYGGDNAAWFDEAMGSIVNQTIQPQEIVLVIDGPVPDSIQNVITKYEMMCKLLGGKSENGK